MSLPYRSHADLGGQLGHGPVVPEHEDVRFHEGWEPAALAMVLAMVAMCPGMDPLLRSFMASPA